MSKKRMITKSVIFLLILAFILKIFSSLSIAMGYNANPLYNYSSYSIFQEPDNSIDVLSIGDLGTAKPAYPGNLRIFKKNLQTPETIYRPN